MKEIKDTCYKGTRILLGNSKRSMLNSMVDILVKKGFEEIFIPIIQYQDIFSNKVGEENNNLMYNFKDRGDRDLCLAPEYTAVIQRLANTTFKDQENVRLFYIQECFRGEKPQAGRYRQFTQLGVEILNPTIDFTPELIQLAHNMIQNSVLPAKVGWVDDIFTPNLIINKDTKRGLDYYKEGKGFEISFELLGAQKQICGGGEYEGGVGFAIGIDRILNINKTKDLYDQNQKSRVSKAL